MKEKKNTLIKDDWSNYTSGNNILYRVEFCFSPLIMFSHVLFFTMRNAFVRGCDDDCLLSGVTSPRLSNVRSGLRG